MWRRVYTDAYCEGLEGTCAWIV
jgi:hypothetical protein